MSKVHILPPEIVSKIAAGEVIERPASVIKECVENSIDAGADTIEVIIKDAGKTLIKVSDNGSGIDRDDLEKIFSRHATSKLRNQDDLYAINSLGFRGEALYSIAAISDVILKTKSGQEAWELHVRGGERQNLKPTAKGIHGTDIEIHELFFNTPARKKFLKSDTAEIQAILNTFVPYCLLHHHIRFRLNHKDKDLIDLRPSESLKSRVAHTLGLDEKFILETSQNFPEYGIELRLILGDINIKRTRRDMQFIFVNGRPVDNKNVTFHLNQIYRLIMPPEEYPFFCVYIQIPSGNIDVNIHPTKREVKIKDDRILFSVLRRMCEEALLRTGQLKRISEPGARVTGPVTQRIEESGITTIQTQHETLHNTPAEQYTFPQTETQPLLETFQTATHLQRKLENARYIGPFMQKFLLFEAGSNLLIIDQHAAAERVTYEQLIKQMNEGNLEVQNLLSPVLVKISPQEMLVWEESKEEFAKVGLESSQFDRETIAIHTHPQLLKDTEKAVRFILAGQKIQKSDHATLARRACRSSIMTGDKLAPAQAEFLRESLLQCQAPFTCPHGRPTVVEMSEDFLDKQFLRK